MDTILARCFIDERGRQPQCCDARARARGEDPAEFRAKTREHNQSHLPVRGQTKVVGHAVRVVFIYRAMADLAVETSDGALKRACETLWDDIASKRTWVTGGYGRLR